MSERIELESGQVLVNVHQETACADDDACCIHRPSSHSMSDFPRLWRSDWGGFMERLCPHGIGHPDPDGLSFMAKARGQEHADSMSVHGCDGCCRP